MHASEREQDTSQPDHHPDSLTIALLGVPTVHVGALECPLVYRKSAALLYYLAAHPGQPHGRSHLAALLWEESDDAAARNSLSTALSRLRRVAPFPIHSAGDRLTWQPDDAVVSDLEQFRRLTTVSGEDDPRVLETAVALYRGQFLAGFELRDSEGAESWLRQEREEWQDRVLAVYRRLVAAYQLRGQRIAAIDAGQRALAIDPAQEAMHRTLMRLHHEEGNRASALAQFRACERALRETFDADPAPETRALRDTIARGDTPAAGAAPVPPRAGPEATQRFRYPLIGRDRELRRLRDALAGDVARQPRMIVIEGEAGIGKTRLVEELPAWLAESGERWTLLLGHSYQDAQGLPYHPFVEALRSQPTLLDVDRLRLPDTWLVEVARLLPEINAPRHNLPEPSPLDPQQERRRLFEGVAHLLAALPPPRLLILEDVHWADSETLHLLAYLVRHDALRDTRFFVTLRSDDTSEMVRRILDSLEYEGWLERLAIPPLTVAMTAELVQAIIPDPVAELAEQTYQEAEGNPLFTVELVRSLVEKGIWQADQQPPRMEHVELPATVQAAIRSRLAQLDQPSRDLLNAAATFRRAFDFDEVRVVVQQRDEIAVEALEALLQMHVLREVVTPVTAGVTATNYRFGHDQVRRAVYDGLSDARRRLLHRRAFDFLSTTRRPQAEELAYHATRGQAWALALEWSERAAVEALTVNAYASAAHLYEQALGCIAQLPPSSEMQQRAIDVRLRLAQVAFYVQPGQLMNWLEQAEAEAGRLADADRLARVRLAQASAHYILGDFTTALPRLEQLRVMAATAEDRALEAQSDNILGRLLVIRGELERGRSLLDRALSAADEDAGLTWSPTPLERATSTGLAAAACAFLGRFAEAEQWLGRIQRPPESAEDAALRAASGFYQALVAHTRGDWPRTIELANAAIADARAADSLIYEYVSHVYLGLALARHGQIGDGLRVERHAIALATRANTRVILGRAHAYLAEILLLAGQVDDASDAASDGMALAEQYGHILEAAICARVLGEISTTRGEWSAAVAALDRAHASLHALAALPELARAEVATGRLLLARGDRDGARAALNGAVERLRAMHLAWDIDRTEAIRATL